jgi:acetyl esterase/lipase
MTDTESGGLELGPRVLPPPGGAGDLLREAIEASSVADRAAELGIVPADEIEWLQFIVESEAEGEAEVMAAVERLPVSVQPGAIAGVDTFHVVPDWVDEAHEDHLLVHVHGGAYVLGGGVSGTAEAIALVLGTGIRAISIDYRMAPHHPYPAAVDDVIAVYQHLLSERSARSIAMGGSSAGGGITLTAIQQLIEQGAEMPAALFIGTPGADLTATGDSFSINQGVDRHIPTLDGFIDAAVRLYAGNLDVADPRISPIYGDFEGFPPTLLVSGTRDLFLSNTVRTHTKLRQAGAEADLLVYEGMAHADYLHVPTAAGSLHFYEELNAFLVKHLRASARRPTASMPAVDSMRWT